MFNYSEWEKQIRIKDKQTKQNKNEKQKKKIN